ncbi:HlyD family efflux transporter periplasmic adaptor subunit [Scytonema sp. UIC 10036]|uniref:HlyD family efflux transporter periplasmic adaptor subunit n=1 Tax=Scytonema sp. UIC 10036 TaxID=2304196 RepID=UPI0012DAB929|nr:HlyD family efflux transporter periplasmic adaptor subunit [Scytonema sp. UIC 10036]MUG96126.1 HlyD family efflux transporter periplasmic adaptor subunit [Scytonema sp. UIC 10036]
MAEPNSSHNELLMFDADSPLDTKNQGLPNPDFLHAATLEEFLPPISNWCSIGGIVLLTIFGVTLTLASFLKYKVTIKTSAVIRPNGELRLVQAATEGTIKSIAVQANQAIKKGDIIATMSDDRLETKKKQLLTNIEQATLQLAQLNAQIKALDGQIAAEGKRTHRAIAITEAELNRSQYDAQQKKAIASAQLREAQANLNRTQVELRKTQLALKSAQAQLKSSEVSLKAAKARRDRYQPLAKTGSISVDRFQEAQLAVQQQEQLFILQTASFEEHQEAIKQQQQVVKAAEARLQAAFASLGSDAPNLTISKAKIAEETAAVKVTLAKLNQEREQLIQQRVEIQKTLNREQEELQQVEDDIKATVLRATASGVIQQLKLRNPLQVVHLGDVVAEIAPNDSPLVIKALVSSSHLRKVKKGQMVQVRVSACPYTDYGTLKARVSSISPDSVTSNNTITQTSAVYEVFIQPESLELKLGDRKCTIQSGMEARADIISSSETVLQFLLRKARLLTDL